MATKKRPPAADDDSATSPSAAAGPTDVFDVHKVRQLVELMHEFDLGLVDLKQGEQRVRLRRGGEPVASAFAPAMPTPVAATPAPLSPKPADAPAPAAGKKTVLIKSPMVGTFYSSPKPDAPPYVKVGDMIAGETVVCIIEAMKVFNELPAETSGRVVAVLAESGTPVEYGQALFEVEPR